MPFTANGGRHRCRPPFHIRSGSGVPAAPAPVPAMPLLAWLNICLHREACFTRRVSSGCRPGREAPGLMPIRAFAQVRAAHRSFRCQRCKRDAPAMLAFSGLPPGSCCKLPEKALSDVVFAPRYRSRSCSHRTGRFPAEEAGMPAEAFSSCSRRLQAKALAALGTSKRCRPTP